MTARTISPATGRLGVLTPGLGAVSSTFIAGVIAARKGLKPPIGSITQMAHIRLGTKEEDRNPLIREFVPLTDEKLPLITKTLKLPRPSFRSKKSFHIPLGFFSV